jgi:putative CocE/NonD family hydrolase
MTAISGAMLALVLACAGAAASAAPEAAAESQKPHGWSDQSYYLAMRDGVRLAVSLYFPGESPPAHRVPAILIQTRYGRARESLRGGLPRDIDFFLNQGNVVAIVDTRGSTSSFGTRDVELGAAERADMDQIIAHLAAQSWSDGRVIAYGISYMADTADLAASRPAPALVAAIPRELDFDAYAHGFMPGGVLNEFLLFTWGRYTDEVDAGHSPSGEARDCRARVADCAALFPLLQPVDADPNYSLLRRALDRGRHWVPEDYLDAPFRDDPGRNGYSMLEFSPASALAGIRREAKPTMTWGSWMDSATAESALARYRSAPAAPMEVWITANNHGHDLGADPFFPERRAPVPDRSAQFAAVHGFIQRVLAGTRIERNIHYYVLGASEFRDTPVGPPAGARPVRYYLASSNALSPKPPRHAATARYEVDFSAGSGTNTRWSTQFGPPPAYPDRRAADARLIVFDSAPLDADVELAGTPLAELYMSARSHDPALFLYLEDVAPDGRVTYITEGEFRVIHRAPADPARLPYDAGPAPHSFRRADARPVTHGESMRVHFALSPVAALIRRGHSLRLAIGGADANVFRRYSEGGADTFSFGLGGSHASSIVVPLRRWRQDKARP